MASKTKDLLSITENILSNSQPAKEVVVRNPELDDGLKAVKVPDAFVENIIGFSGRLNEGETVSYKEKPVQYLNEAKLAEERIVSLVERLKSLIVEAREVMQEMTSVGMLGVGPQTNLLKKKKRKKKG